MSVYVCSCRAITEAEVQRAGHAGVTAPDDLIVLFGLNDETCCGRCARRTEHFVTLAVKGAARGDLAPTTALPTTPSVITGAARALLKAAVRPAPTRV